jgi:hypothetical protein
MNAIADAVHLQPESLDSASGLAPEYRALLANAAAALRVAQRAISDLIAVNAPHQSDPLQVQRARQRIADYGPLFYLVTTAEAIRQGLHGIPVPFDPERRDALCWRAFCALPAVERARLINALPPPSALDAALRRALCGCDD